MGCSSGKPVVEGIDDATASESAPATLVEEKPRNFYIDLESVHAQLHGSPPSVRLLNSEWVLARADELLAAQSDEERAQLALPHLPEAGRHLLPRGNGRCERAREEATRSAHADAQPHA